MTMVEMGASRDASRSPKARPPFHFFRAARERCIRPVARAVSLLGLAVSLLTITPQAKSDDRITIGVILPLTGDMANVGAAGRDAVLLALEDLPPDVRGRYRVIFEDDNLSSATAAKAAQKLISVDGVQAIISTWSYGGMVVAPLAERAKVPHIGIAWDHVVAKGEYNFLHLTPPHEFMKRFLEAFRRLKVTRVALLGVEESGSVFAMDEFVRLAPDYGVQVVFRDAVMWDLTDFNSVLARIVKQKPEYLLINLGGDGLVLKLLNSIRRQRASFDITAITSFDVISDLSGVEGRWYVSDSYLPDEMAERFRLRFGHVLRYGIGNYYEAARLLISAYEKAPQRTSAQAKDVLLAMRNVPSIFGPTSVDKEGIFTYPAQYMAIHDGDRQPITPEELVKAEHRTAGMSGR